MVTPDKQRAMVYCRYKHDRDYTTGNGNFVNIRKGQMIVGQLQLSTTLYESNKIRQLG